MLTTQSFEKKGKTSSEEGFWPVFSPIIEHDKCQPTPYQGPQDGLASIVRMKRPFFWEIGGR